MTRAEAVGHAEHWIDAWNAHDLDRIMSFYAEDVIFEAETVKKRWQKGDGTLHGTEELKRHFALGLSLVPTLRFRLQEVFLAPSGYAVLYERENGNRVIDCVTMNDNGLAARVTAYYVDAPR
jgi:hypothetical protein